MCWTYFLHLAQSKSNSSMLFFGTRCCRQTIAFTVVILSLLSSHSPVSCFPVNFPPTFPSRSCSTLKSPSQPYGFERVDSSSSFELFILIVITGRGEGCKYRWVAGFCWIVGDVEAHQLSTNETNKKCFVEATFCSPQTSFHTHTHPALSLSLEELCFHPSRSCWAQPACSTHTEDVARCSSCFDNEFILRLWLTIVGAYREVKFFLWWQPDTTWDTQQLSGADPSLEACTVGSVAFRLPFYSWATSDYHQNRQSSPPWLRQISGRLLEVAGI